MNEREQAFALRLLQRWREFTRYADPAAPTFQRTYVALAAETDDFLQLDSDPPRPVPKVTPIGSYRRLLAHVPSPKK